MAIATVGAFGGAMVLCIWRPWGVWAAAALLAAWAIGGIALGARQAAADGVDYSAPPAMSWRERFRRRPMTASLYVALIALQLFCYGYWVAMRIAEGSPDLPEPLKSLLPATLLLLMVAHLLLNRR